MLQAQSGGDWIMCRWCLSWYGRHIAPYVVHAGCSARAFSRMRQRMVPLAKGVVVEVGFGSGLNLPCYVDGKVKRLIGIAAAPGLWFAFCQSPTVGTIRSRSRRVRSFRV